MAILAWIFGSLGGLSVVMAIITALTLIPEFEGLSWQFWFSLSTSLLLIAVAFAVVCRGGGSEEL
jgi:hypothetical protein